MNEHTPNEVEDMPEPKPLRNLRLLVTILTATMILGIITIIALIVIKIAQPGIAPLALPDEIALPDGETAQAITQGLDWIGVVTVDDAGEERIHIMNMDGSYRQSVNIKP